MTATAKILAGLLAALAVTGVGIYAATGSVPGAETVGSAFTSDAGCDGGSCSKMTVCPLPSGCGTEAITADAATCPADGLGACAGGMTAGVASPTQPKRTCCDE